MSKVENTAQLRAIKGEPSVQVRRKIHRRLNDRARQFIAHAPLLLLSTADAEGQPTVSPKGDSGGLVRVTDDETLLEHRGGGSPVAAAVVFKEPRRGASDSSEACAGVYRTQRVNL